MATIKVKFRPSSVPNREGTIYYQIVHHRVCRQFVSGHHVFASEWNEKREDVIVNAKSQRKDLLMKIRESIHQDLARFSRLMNKMCVNGQEPTADEMLKRFVTYSKDYTLFNFFERAISRLKQTGKLRTAETYQATLNNFRKFRMNKDMMLDALNSELMEEYEAWNKNRGLCPNTISFYTRILRAVYNRAVEEEIIDNRFPFRHVYTGVDKTVKRAIPLNLIRDMKRMALPAHSNLDFARDMFLLSFYMRGMSFIDMAFLRKSDLYKNRLSYRRRKTGQLLIIEWTKEMQLILDKYPKHESPYLLPIICDGKVDARTAYRNAMYRINRCLKKIGGLIGSDYPLTLYVARHSWASAAKRKGVPLSVISEGMGHESEKTTRIYLASLERSVVDKANSMLIRSIR